MNRNYEDAPHVLVITGDTEEDRDYEIIHPDCPEACYWSPHMRQIVEDERKAKRALSSLNEDGVIEGHRTCIVAYEVENVGLDCLFGTIDGVQYEGGTQYIDGKWEADGWRKIPPGRYIIQGWAEPGGWAGSEPIDPDGGIDLIGREEDTNA